MKKIKVYDLKGLIEKQDFEGDKLTTFDFHKIAILKGDNGVFAFDNEGVGILKNNINEEITIGLNDIPKENRIYAMPQYNLDIKLSEIIEEAEFEEMTLTQFIKDYNYNNRLIRNFKGVLKTIDKIGLKSEDYYVE